MQPLIIITFLIFLQIYHTKSCETLNAIANVKKTNIKCNRQY